MSLDQRIVDYLQGQRLEDEEQFPAGPVPPSWQTGATVADPTPVRAPAPAPAAPPSPQFNIMDYFKAMRPELFSQQAADDAIAEDEATNRNREVQRTFARSLGFLTRTPADYTGLGPSDVAAKRLGMRQDQAIKSAQVGGQVGQFMTSMDSQNPTSLRSLMAYNVKSKDPFIGPRLRELGPPGTVSEAQIAQLEATIKTGGEVGKDYATINKDKATTQATIGEEGRKSALHPLAMTAASLANDEAAVKPANIVSQTNKNNAETAKINAETTAMPGQKAATAETDLRKEWTGQQVYKDAQTVADSWAKIQAAPASGAGDVALLYGYMKILDPGSAVREGEIALGKDTGSVPESVRIAYNKAVAGEQFTPEMRARFKASALAAYNAQIERYRKTAAEYARIAKERGVAPGNVVLDVGLVPATGGGAAPGAGLLSLQPKN